MSDTEIHQFTLRGTDHWGNNVGDWYHKEAHGSNTPKELRDNGQFAENPYDLIISSSTDSIVSGSEKPDDENYPWFDFAASSLGGSPSLTFIPLPSDLDDILSTFLARWRGTRLNLGVVVGETRPTIGMVHSRLSKLRSAAAAVSLRDGAAAVRHLFNAKPVSWRGFQKKLDLGDLSGAWLELRYGWIPMLSDIFEGCKVIQQKARPLKVSLRSSKQVKDEVISSNSPSNEEGKLISGKRRTGVYVKATATRLPTFMEAFGLVDPASIIWELMPYSFVADWFLPIGQSIEAFHAIRVIPATSVVLTEIQVAQGFVGLQSGKKYAGFTIQGSSKNSGVRVLMSRKTYGSLQSAFAGYTVPLWSKGIPTTGKPLTRLADAVSLLHQQLTGLGRASVRNSR